MRLVSSAGSVLSGVGLYIVLRSTRRPDLHQFVNPFCLWHPTACMIVWSDKTCTHTHTYTQILLCYEAGENAKKAVRYSCILICTLSFSRRSQTVVSHACSAGMDLFVVYRVHATCCWYCDYDHIGGQARQLITIFVLGNISVHLSPGDCSRPRRCSMWSRSFQL